MGLVFIYYALLSFTTVHASLKYNDPEFKIYPMSSEMEEVLNASEFKKNVFAFDFSKKDFHTRTLKAGEQVIKILGEDKVEMDFFIYDCLTFDESTLHKKYPRISLETLNTSKEIVLKEFAK